MVHRNPRIKAARHKHVSLPSAVFAAVPDAEGRMHYAVFVKFRLAGRPVEIAADKSIVVIHSLHAGFNHLVEIPDRIVGIRRNRHFARRPFIAEYRVFRQVGGTVGVAGVEIKDRLLFAVQRFCDVETASRVGLDVCTFGLRILPVHVHSLARSARADAVDPVFHVFPVNLPGVHRFAQFAHVFEFTPGRIARRPCRKVAPVRLRSENARILRSLVAEAVRPAAPTLRHRLDRRSH